MTDYWKKCVDFHGHECGGLTIGYKAALYVIDLWDVKFSKDEELVCISENDACGVDAIQSILGCSVGKGNLLFHMTGKQAFTFYDRNKNKGIRLVLKEKPEGMTREESFEYYQKLDPKDMFDVKEPKIKLPQSARIFDSFICEECGEKAGSKWIRIENGKKLCIDCATKYDRFNI
ncbi:formylmethanofuran dehydrogenase subunit E [Acetitomaculum ruminis DSM 5522]|uniref:Formylmethanofuran dehydrogenase subunit E n=1 Tax=Acetitomaculum ruminis DSM 5522 TaxID=1120918 RepID=A0A1I0ZNY3_9FIRM|nr:FmdE family protein [Acetitomaculum ruminis]SFB27072.1 formylmethanofuran dehydrogenase subunit E [Acetitomaculum ruminis DSM 5522]